MSAAPLSPAQRLAAQVAASAWVALLLLALLWELLLAPLRPGGSWLVLKALPLLLPLRGVLRADVKAMQWALLLVLLFVAEGSVRIADPVPTPLLAMTEIALGLLFFIAAIAYLRPFKRAARARSR